MLAKIKQEYEGQAYKVTNALWGAGQMMFNKVLVVLDYDISWDNYVELARQGLANFSPRRDVLLGKGPMDVLDHSCKRLGLGGKICLDLTRKVMVEPNLLPAELDEEAILALSDEVVGLDSSFLAQRIPVLLVFVNKQSQGIVARLHAQLGEYLTGVKIVLFFDTNVPRSDYGLLMWIAFNNIEPGLDTLLDYEHDFLSCDATIKTKDLDDFPRDWPNPVLSDLATIEAIDRKWHSLGLGEFISSPSRKLQSFMRGSEASIYGIPIKPSS